ncbi:unnamed protein product [Acanthoscelides obtectus]|uniref:DDE Tnp4 domain-containing protein n=1 Tax=Acanthoscelides obtectus TaxID=200917 RepID=A0A9P0LI95_ACAOB|nr:unnamed protein product [Acanthoscelides obtectus]CAK1655257.1 Putative nuclease HARBI1 [Acanthoscelides obtectus]
MPELVYEELLRLVTPIIAKQDTCMREAISPHERLSATSRFLITDATYTDLMYSSVISRQSLGNIPETCDAIYSALKTYLKFPNSKQEWIAIAEEFERRWQFPNCLGAVDGKHFAIVPPAGAGSHFFNYKGYHSIVLLAIANLNDEFIYVDIGTNGRISDGGVLRKTKFFQRFASNSVNLPSPRKPSGHLEELPYVFIGDEAFALRTDFIKPYPQRQSQARSSKIIYNYRVQG